MNCPRCFSDNVLEMDNLYTRWACGDCGFTSDGSLFDFELVTCPFCEQSHPDEFTCGCPGEREEAQRIDMKIYLGQQLTAVEDKFLTAYEMLS